jgi:hypothetical protein
MPLTTVAATSQPLCSDNAPIVDAHREPIVRVQRP